MIPTESVVRFVASDPFGGGNLRSFWPAEALNGIGVRSRCEMYLPKPVYGEYTTVVMHRPLFPAYPNALLRMHEISTKVIVDEDDDLSRIHQTKNEIGLQEWVPAAIDAHDIAMRIADAVTVSTPALQETYSAVNANVHVCRNYLPERYGEIRWYGKRDDVWVGWAGITMTHRHDLEWIAPEFKRLMYGALFHTIGDPKTCRVLGYHGPAKWEGFQNKPEELYKLMSACDVAIVPLLPCEFNEAKSWLKALEYMTVGVPVVATDLPEQRELITHGENGFLAKTPAEMADYVQLLIRDPELRKLMGKRAAKRAAELTIEKHADEWLVAVQSAEAHESTTRVGARR